MGIALFIGGAVYVVAAFAAPDPFLRVLLRCAPFLPLTIWTIWFDAARPLQGQPSALRETARVLLLVLVMGIVVALLGLGLNWLYDPSRIV